MRPRIAIPIPHAGDPEYADRALPQYQKAVEMSGGEPVAVPLDKTPAQVMQIIERCDAVLLPGSKADVDPSKYGAPRHPDTAASDPKRDTVDELLLQDAYNMRKPILGICYGIQILNVYRSGSLIQHIESPVNHAAGRRVPVAHAVEVEADSRLARIVTAAAKAAGVEQRLSAAFPARASGPASAAEGIVIPVNSSHHQSADIVGDGLRAIARCPEDGIIEAVEGTSPEHFVLAVQWHPERSVDVDEPSRAIFRALVEAARARHERLAGEFEGL